MLTKIRTKVFFMGQPAARITDMHVCAMATGLVPHVGGPITTGMPTVITGGMPQARITDICVCVGPPDVIVKGSPTVLVGGLMAARIGDLTAHGGTIVTGFPTVLIGEAGAGGGGFGGAGGGSGDVAISLATSGPGLESPLHQAKALADAAVNATPFIERCMPGAPDIPFVLPDMDVAADQANTLVAAALNATPFCVPCAMSAVSQLGQAVSALGL